MFPSLSCFRSDDKDDKQHWDDTDDKQHWELKQTSALLAIAVGSRCMNSEESSSSSFFDRFMSVCSNRAWYLTGNPYLEENAINSPTYTLLKLKLWNYFNHVMSTYLRADSTNTLNAFKWIQATNSSLKCIFSQCTNTLCGKQVYLTKELQ